MTKKFRHSKSGYVRMVERGVAWLVSGTHELGWKHCASFLQAGASTWRAPKKISRQPLDNR